MSAPRGSVPPPADILKRLLSAGYFPSELPPPFTTQKFGQSAVVFAAKWNPVQIRKFWTAPEHYSIPRYGQVRRKLSLVNPVNQLHVAHLISDNWSAVLARLQRSKITEFRPAISMMGGRAVTGVDFDGVGRRKTEILARFGRYVKTDIARFYPSIYTHSIAWSLLGKGWVKNNHKTSAFKKSFADNLDKAVFAGQSGQTIGIPIGPDTSRIISELVATELESIAHAEIPDLDARAVRYVDDMIIGLQENESADAVLSKVSSALHEYELEINGEKTSVFGLGYPHAPEWLHYIRNYTVAPSGNRQREDVDSFFE